MPHPDGTEQGIEQGGTATEEVQLQGDPAQQGAGTATGQYGEQYPTQSLGLQGCRVKR